MHVPLEVCCIVGVFITGVKAEWQVWIFHKDAEHFKTDIDLHDAINTAQDFSYTSRLTCGVSFEDQRYDVMTGYFSPLSNLPRSGAQQIVRVRDFSLKTGFVSVSEDCNKRVMAKPLGFQENKILCENREDFSLNVIDDWGTKLNTLRVRKPSSIRTLFYHICHEKALSGRPKYYKKLQDHWNTESGFMIKTYDEFLRALPVTQYLCSILCAKATNLIVAMSGSLPPFWEPHSDLEQEGLVARPVIGSRPDFKDIAIIDGDQYAILSRLPDAAVSTDEFWKMRKYEYCGLFVNLSDAEKVNHWELYRDYRQKVFNIQRQCSIQVSDIESLSDHRWTIRGGGQDLRSRQLSEIRTICRILRI